MDFYHLDEQQRRRADWRPGEPLDFGRYGVWHLPRVDVATGLHTSAAGSYPMPEYRINGASAGAFYDLSVAMAESPDRFNAGMDLFHFVLGRNYDLSRPEFVSLVTYGLESLPGAEQDRTLARLTGVAFNKPVADAERLVRSYPRFKADGSGLLVGQN